MYKVQVLLSTYNGEVYLEEQLNSLIHQAYIKPNILVRDDGSTDGTKDILRKWEKLGLLTWYEGENLKPTKSFFDLVRNAEEADYYAFCDQDDVWDELKLITACKLLEKSEGNKASLYFSNVYLVDKDLNLLQKECFDFALNFAGVYYNDSYKEKIIQQARCFTFEEVLLGYNCATGCTMVFNSKLCELLNRFVQNCDVSDRNYHDYYTYLICLAVGGNIMYDINSYIKYRQHENNVVGVNKKNKKNVLTKFLIKNFSYIKLLLGYNNNKHFATIRANNLLDIFENVLPDNSKKSILNFKTYKYSLKNKLKLISLLNITKYKCRYKIELVIKVLRGHL